MVGSLRGVDKRHRSLVADGEDVRPRHLGSQNQRVQVARKATDDPEAALPGVRVGGLGQGGPGDRPLRRHRGRPDVSRYAPQLVSHVSCRRSVNPSARRRVKYC